MTPDSNAWSGSHFLGCKWNVSIKHDLVPDNRIYEFSDIKIMSDTMLDAELGKLVPELLDRDPPFQPRPTVCLQDAWELVEEMHKRGHYLRMAYIVRGQVAGWHACFGDRLHENEIQTFTWSAVGCFTPQMAISLAAFTTLTSTHGVTDDVRGLTAPAI